MRVEAKVVGYGKLDPNERVALEYVKLQGADYSGRELKYFGSVGSRFERCRFDNMRVDDFSFGAGMAVSEYLDCTFDGSHLIHGGGYARFVRCSFRNVQLRDWFCFEAEFVDCVFTGRLRKCIFNGTVPEEHRSWVGRERNEFRGNDFSGAEFVDVSFRTGIDLDLQRLLSGPDYLYVPDAAAAIERAKRGLADWKPDTEHQRLALVIVGVYAEDVNDGQQQLFLRPSDHYKGPAKTPREVVDKVVSLFRGDAVA